MTAPSGYTSISGEYPRFAYIKIYRKGTTKQAMLETLKELTGSQEAHTFGSIPGAYNTYIDYINAASGDELVKRLMTELEPIGIGHG